MSKPADAHERVTIAGRTFVVHGRIGVGERADVFRGASEGSLPQAVVIKIARDESEAAALAREAKLLMELGRSRDNAAYHFTRMLPDVVAHGATEDGLPATAFRRMFRYSWTLEDVIREYPEGVEPEAAAWMWNRQLTLLGWLHRKRVAHGAVAPEHVLIHPLNHGARFVGWSSAGAFGSAPDLRPERDIARSARVIVKALGGMSADGKMKDGVPVALAEFLVDTLDTERRKDAVALHDEFKSLCERAFGKPRYRPFHMPRPSAG